MENHQETANPSSTHAGDKQDQNEQILCLAKGTYRMGHEGLSPVQVFLQEKACLLNNVAEATVYN